MYQMFNNPYQQYVSPMTNNQQLIRVNGIESAKAYQTTPNSTVALFDSNEDIMYIKSTDASNFPTIRRFRFVEEQENKVNENTESYITRDEFLQFKEEVFNNVKQFISDEYTNKQTKSVNATSKQSKTE